ncbi:hypothetical protein J6500_00660 [Bradyrhizobium sp. WSM 1704]|uniref:hypothetical protein n=1 Tax=Bradyrhizobium semiaridum TaxID=2821404 RepID=UPI001CE2D474|nr:hypothetical protein [Bradyrhizobium semiaridum]MCA6120418.1 hypothetical protein [Bradyrhizobium semiaridum]
MAKDTDKLAADIDAEGGGLLAEEEAFDRRLLWRLGSWGLGAVGAVTIAVMANQSALTLKRDQVAAADIARQAQQLQTLAKESHNETRRLAAAIDTLNGDRDRLYSRVTTLEQGLDFVTGTIAKQDRAPLPAATTMAAAPALSAAPASAPPVVQAPAPVPVAATAPPGAPDKPAPPDKASADSKPSGPAETAAEKKSAAPSASPAADEAKAAAPAPPAVPVADRPMIAMAEPAASKPLEPVKPPTARDVSAAPIAPLVVAPDPDSELEDDAVPPKAIQRTEFGIDLGTANSVNGLRALWRGLLKSKANAPLAALRPIIVIKENTNGLGMQLRLVAGPLNDAGTAAKICAGLSLNQRTCETAIYDGQRLSLKADDPPAPSRPAHRRAAPRRAVAPPPPPVAEEKKPEPATFSSMFRRNSQ